MDRKPICRLPFNKVDAASRGQEVGVGAGLGDAGAEDLLWGHMLLHDLRHAVLVMDNSHLLAELEADAAPLLRASQLQGLVRVRRSQQFARIDVRSKQDGKAIVVRRIDGDAPDVG